MFEFPGSAEDYKITQGYYIIASAYIKIILIEKETKFYAYNNFEKNANFFPISRRVLLKGQA